MSNIKRCLVSECKHNDKSGNCNNWDIKLDKKGVCEEASLIRMASEAHKTEVIKKHCSDCYWHKYHGCHISIGGINNCINVIALEELKAIKKENEDNDF